MKLVQQQGAKKREPLYIVAADDYSVLLTITDILLANKARFYYAKNLPQLAMLLEETTRQVAVIDLTPWGTELAMALTEHVRRKGDCTCICLVTEEQAQEVHAQTWSGHLYLVAKENLAEEFPTALRQCSETRNLRYQAEDLLKLQKQSLYNTLSKEAEQMKPEDQSIFKRTLTRRSFLKGAATTAAAAGLVVSGGGTLLSPMVEAAGEGTEGKEELFCTPCRSNCFQCCMLNAHVRNGKIVKTSMRSSPIDDYNGCCLKGMSLVQRTYSPTRVKYPMRRIGERGADQWERITWDEAIAEVAEKFTAAQKQYGDRAVAVDTGSGCYGMVHGVSGVIGRLSNALGATRINVCYDQAIGYGTNRVIGGGIWLRSNETADMLRAKAILIWGSNPIYAQPQNWRFIAKAKRGGTKVVCIDPVRTATANKCDEYVPVTPGTDLLLILGMMRIVIEENWLDKDYLQFKSTAPYLVRRDTGMLLRRSDLYPDTEKEEDYYVYDKAQNKAVLSKDMVNPAMEGSYTIEGIETDTSYSLLKARILEYELSYVAEKTGIPMEKIYELTDLYANSGASTIYSNYGIDHYQNGHLWGVCMAMLAVMTGNIARPGCSVGGAFVNSTMRFNSAAMSTGNSNGKLENGIIPQTSIGEVFRTQQLNGEPYPLKVMLTAGSNSMSNFAEQNQWKNDIIPNLDYWVVIDTELTDAARYADLVLPAAFWMEVNDMRLNTNTPYVSIQNKAIEPLYESKPDMEIIYLIAHAMGLGEYFPPMEDTDWIKVLLDLDYLREMNVTYERLQEEKVLVTATSDGEPFVRGVYGFPTATGKAELYCENPVPRTNFGQDISNVWEKERLPYFKPPNEAWSENPLFNKYPLVYIQEHARFRVHTQWYNVPMLKELEPEPVARLSRKDADERGIQNGDMVEVYNDRGRVVLKAVVDDSVNVGVLIIPKGWQMDQFKEGAYQELTNTSSDPMACNFAYFDALVNVRKH